MAHSTVQFGQENLFLLKMDCYANDIMLIGRYWLPLTAGHVSVFGQTIALTLKEDNCGRN